MPRTTLKTEASSSYRTPSFHNLGDTFRGYLLKQPVERHKTKFGSQEKEYWDDEKLRPRMEYIYDFLSVDEAPYTPATCYFCKKVQANRLGKGLPDLPEVPEPGGRRIYASWKQHNIMQEAFRAVPNVELYGLLVLRYEGDDMAKKKDGFEAPKVWKAAYRNPTDEEVAKCDEFLGVDTTPLSQEDIAATYENLLDMEVPTNGSKKLSLDEMDELSNLPDLE